MQGLQTKPSRLRRGSERYLAMLPDISVAATVLGAKCESFVKIIDEISDAARRLVTCPAQPLTIPSPVRGEPPRAWRISAAFHPLAPLRERVASIASPGEGAEGIMIVWNYAGHDTSLGRCCSCPCRRSRVGLKPMTVHPPNNRETLSLLHSNIRGAM